MLRHRGLRLHAGVIGCYYFGVFAAIAGTPLAYIGYYHVSPQLYGVLFAAATIGIMAANWVNARSVMRFGRQRMLLAGAAAAALAGVVVAWVALTGFGGLFGLVVPVMLFLAMNGLLVANAITSALADFPERAGAASALTGAIQYGGGIAGSAVVGVLADRAPAGLGWAIGLSACGTLTFAVLVCRAGD